MSDCYFCDGVKLNITPDIPPECRTPVYLAELPAPREDASSGLACLFSCALVFGAGYLLGKV